MQYTSKELGGLIKDYQKQQKDINALINSKPNKLTKTEKEQYKKDLADISKSLSEAKLHNDTLQKDMKRVITRIEERKKELDWSGKEAERIKENRKTMQSGLDKAARLIAEIEKEIESLKQQLLDK